MKTKGLYAAGPPAETGFTAPLRVCLSVCLFMGASKSKDGRLIEAQTVQAVPAHYLCVLVSYPSQWTLDRFFCKVVCSKTVRLTPRGLQVCLRGRLVRTTDARQAPPPRQGATAWGGPPNENEISLFGFMVISL
jgi:hypothetical protein